MLEPNANDQSDVPAGSEIKPIPYATPGARMNPGVIPVKGRMAIGCFGYVLLSVLWFVSLPYFLPQFEKHWTINGLPWWAGVAGWGVMTAGLLVISLWLRLKFGYKGYGYGILSILGAAGLLLPGLYLLLLAICGTGTGGSGHSQM